VATLATSLLVVAAVAQPLNGPVFVLDGILIGASDLGYLARAMAVSFAGFLPLVAAVWWLDAGVAWLWWALVGFMGLRLATLWRRWCTDDWMVLGARDAG
jgi:Na+-driven multidrug efflux pump